MSDTTISKANNLARIRDNQRRSRARRKEYLQELEAKLRNCEQMGIEASAEIQSAARKVLEENRKLRALLREKGVPEEDIMAVMNPNDRNFDYGSAAPILSSMLERKRPCNTQIPSSTGPGQGQQTQTTLPYSPAPISIPPQRAVTLGHRTGSASPHSMGSSSVDTPSSFNTPTFSHVPMTSARDIQEVENIPQLNYQYEQPLHTPWIFPQDTSYVAEHPVTYNNTSSCVYAANIIRTMRTDVGTELEADLGCRELGQDCTVNNTTVFNVMDKYTNHGPGMRYAE